MWFKPVLTLVFTFVLPFSAWADDAKIKSAESAGPYSLSKNATIKDWSMKVLRKGTNEWTCFPDNASTPGNDPWCVNKPWLNFLDAYINKKKPTYTEAGVAYMLQGDTAVNNADPFDTEKNKGEDWVEGLGAHVMIISPDPKFLKSFPTSSKTGGPWLMWGDTPYAHIMMQVDSYPLK